MNRAEALNLYQGEDMKDCDCAHCNCVRLSRELKDFEEIMEEGKRYLLTTRPEEITVDDTLRAFGLEGDGGDYID